MLAIYRKRLHRKPPPVMYPEGLEGRQVCSPTAAGKRMYRSNLYEMEVRQGFKCAICERIAGSMMQFDHQDGRGSGGGHRDDRIVDGLGNWINAALCATCNSLKGSKRYQWIEGKYQEVVRQKFKEIA